ncbi:MAG: mechanosensitive ion channel family protein, partial [Allosphingosinicella sp.]
MYGTTAQAHTLFERSAERWYEITKWISANSLDLILAALIAGAIALFLLALRRFGYRLIRDRDLSISWQTIFGRVLAKTTLFFIVMTAVKLVAGQAQAPFFLQRTIDVLFIVAVALQSAIWARELVLGFIQHRIGYEDDTGRLSSALAIIRLFVTVTMFAIAIIVILDNIGV